MQSFADFKKLALDKTLNNNQKVGFDDIYRKELEKNIFLDISLKLNIIPNKTIMDIGCGCSLPVYDLIEYARNNKNKLYLIDSKEMLSNLPNEDFIVKIICEFPNCKEIQKLQKKIDYIIVYSVLHHIFTYANYIEFIDTTIELLSSNGELLLGDIPNISKQKRFSSLSKKIEYTKDWFGNIDKSNITYNTLEKMSIDDGIIFSILQRYRGMGCETYLLNQKKYLPLGEIREDILIKKY